jgi:tRNA-Thr(GGU) m(6)t(6)A37 methyltransferase TsaA|tara:strand:- start:1232 stop:2020 length:789 start_codon:yes stop_codon:yes gene_type:complete
MATFEPIGRVTCPQRYRYEAPRQGVLRPDNHAVIELLPGNDYEQALTGLEGFERIWVIFELHLNESWHPLVQPPHEGASRRGLFATRSPHRPNRIGLTCVRLLGIDGLNLSVAGHDLLDATPVLDIKPYLPYADAFDDAAIGWLEDVPVRHYSLSFDDDAATRARWIFEHGALDCDNFARVQLMQDPTDAERKRISAKPTPGDFVIAYRTWRLDYVVMDEARSVRVTGIRSGYSTEDLVAGSADRHDDKELHRAFVQQFSAP